MENQQTNKENQRNAEALQAETENRQAETKSQTSGNGNLQAETKNLQSETGSEASKTEINQATAESSQEIRARAFASSPLTSTLAATSSATATTTTNAVSPAASASSAQNTVIPATAATAAASSPTAEATATAPTATTPTASATTTSTTTPGVTMTFVTTEDQDDGFYNWQGQLKVSYNIAIPYERFYSVIRFDTTNLNPDATVERIWLVLTAKPGSSGYFLINNRTYAATDGKYRIDVTSVLSASGSKKIEITPVRNCNFEFYVNEVSNPGLAPTLEYEYAVPDKMQKQIALSVGATVYLDVESRNATIEIPDFTAEDTNTSLTLSHVYTGRSDGQPEYGNCQLNVNERIYEITYSEPSAYVYADGYGNDCRFKKCYYYVTGTSVVYLTDAQAKNVVYDGTGKATYGGKTLTVVYYTQDGYEYGTAMPKAVQKLSVYEELRDTTDTTKKPVHFLNNGNIVKGYNKYGYLVLICYKNGTCNVLSNTSAGITTISEYPKSGTPRVFTLKSTDTLTYIATLGKSVTYGYESGVLKTMTNSNGKNLTLTYDGYRLTTLQSSDGLRSELTYDAEGRLTSVTEYSERSCVPGGTTGKYIMGKTTYAWVGNGKTTKIVRYGYTESGTAYEAGAEYYTFDAKGALTERKTETNGLISDAERYSYTPYVSRTVTKAAKTTLNKSAYASYVFAEGEKTEYTLNTRNQVTISKVTGIRVSAASELGYETSYSYNASGQCVEERCIMDERTFINQYEYDADGNPTKKTEHVQILNTEQLPVKYEEYSYTEYGELSKRERAYNAVTPEERVPHFYESYSYDGSGRLQRQESFRAENNTHYVNGCGLLLFMTTPNGTVTNYTYDARNRLTGVTSGDSGNTIEYTDGEITKASSGTRTIEYRYDGKRRISEIKVNGESYETYTYQDGTLNGKAAKTVEIRNAKDEIRRTSVTLDGSAAQTTFGTTQETPYRYELQYNKDGTVSKEIVGETEGVYTYDGYGHLTNYARGAYAESYTYNDQGELTEVQTTGPNAVLYKYGYTGAKRLLGSETYGPVTITQKRDSHDRETGRTVTLSGRTIETTTISYYSYDGAYGINLYSTFLPNSVSYTRGGGTKTLAYTYDNMNNIATITDGTETITYTYDSQNRLIREDNEKLWQSYVYTYDAEGNITSKKTGVYMAADTNMSTSSYVYADGKLMRYGTQRFLYDAAGNPTVYRSKTATWVGRKLTSYNGTTFGYDGKGRRISKDDIEYTYDSNDRLIASSDGMQYYYDHTGVSGFRYNNATYVYEKDIQGNIIAILDSIGRVVVEYTYDAWGNHTVTTYGGNSTLGAINPFRYRGYFYDTETGFYYLQTRYYDPVIGRFLNMDSIDYADPETINGLNLYAYSLNNPVMYNDPTGHFAIGAFLIGLTVSTLVGWALSEIFGSQISGGINSVVNGASAIYTGVGLLSFGPVGWVAGGALILIGIGTIVFGANEIIAGATETNYIQQWTGMSDGLYEGLYIGLNVASAFGTIAGNIYMKYNPRYPGNNPDRIPDGFKNRVNPKANYYNPRTGQSLHPDLQHPAPINPHWDWKDSNGNWWRLYRFYRIRK